VLLNVIASLLLKLAKDNFIKLYDLANPAAEDAARKVVDDKLKAYSSRPAVVEAGVTEDWSQSFFLCLSAITSSSSAPPTLPLTTTAMRATKYPMLGKARGQGAPWW
jgi:hypothetical protein